MAVPTDLRWPPDRLVDGPVREVRGTGGVEDFGDSDVVVPPVQQSEGVTARHEVARRDALGGLSDCGRRPECPVELAPSAVYRPPVEEHLSPTRGEQAGHRAEQ